MNVSVATTEFICHSPHPPAVWSKSVSQTAVSTLENGNDRAGLHRVFVDCVLDFLVTVACIYLMIFSQNLFLGDGNADCRQRMCWGSCNVSLQLERLEVLMVHFPWGHPWAGLRDRMLFTQPEMASGSHCLPHSGKVVCSSSRLVRVGKWWWAGGGASKLFLPVGFVPT